MKRRKLKKKETLGQHKVYSIHVMGVPEREERERSRKKKIEELRAKNFLNFLLNYS